MHKSVVLGLAVAGLAATHALATDSDRSLVLAFGVALATIEVAALTALAGGFTAVVAPVIVVNAVMLGALMAWETVRFDSIVSARVDVTTESLILAAIVGIVSTAAFALGAALIRPRSVQLGKKADLASLIQISNGPLVAAGFAIIALTVYARRGALLRGEYLAADGPEWAVGLSNSLMPLGLVVLAIAAFRPGSGRVFAAIGVATLSLVLFGRASRSLALIPAVILIAMLLGRDRRIKPIAIVVAAVSTLVLLQLPLTLRANPSGVGVLTLGQLVLADPATIFEDFGFGPVLGNIVFSGPLVATVANRPIDPAVLWLSLNPAPGSLTDWSTVSRTLRIDGSTPYAGLGELAAHGWFTLAAVSFALGLTLSAATQIARATPGRLGLVSSLIVLAVTAFFSVSLLQYNLRSSVRLIWYILAAVMGLWVLAKLGADPRSAKSHTKPALRRHVPLLNKDP